MVNMFIEIVVLERLVRRHLTVLCIADGHEKCFKEEGQNYLGYRLEGIGQNE